ncbi:MAG: c-type cytochrome biogenesis protein CcmI [Paracoccaceae bacterium]
MTFWIIAVLIGTGTVAFMARPLFRTAKTAPRDETKDLLIYRDQLAEVERDLQRGVLSEAEAGHTRLEVSRRLLAADRIATEEVPAGTGPVRWSPVMAGLFALALIGGSGAIYLLLGAPGTPDMPFAKRDFIAENAGLRPSQQEGEARFGPGEQTVPGVEKDYLELVKRLREVASLKPDDIRGQELLVEHEGRLGNYKAAYAAKGRVIALRGEAADGNDYAQYAELMIVAAGGYVSPMAERALAVAVRMNPDSPLVRYYSGLLMAQTGRPGVAYEIWSRLLGESPPDAPWVAAIRAQIGEIANMAGIEPESLPGPSGQQMNDAREMSDQDRQEMIRSMVKRSADQLAR